MSCPWLLFSFTSVVVVVVFNTTPKAGFLMGDVSFMFKTVLNGQMAFYFTFLMAQSRIM